MPISKSALDDARNPLIANAPSARNVALERDVTAAKRQQDRAVNELEARQRHDRHAGGRYTHERTTQAIDRHHVHEHQRLAERNDRALDAIEGGYAREQQISEARQRRYEVARREFEEQLRHRR